jgi:hypothetical protein
MVLVISKRGVARFESLRCLAREEGLVALETWRAGNEIETTDNTKDWRRTWRICNSWKNKS